MACPFLKEGRARYCHAAPLKKLILDGPGATQGGRCTSADYRACEWFVDDGTAHDHCPHLEEIRVQYCGVAPVTKLVPFSDSELSSCTSNSYRYCDSYLSLARPHASVPLPQLLYSSNPFAAWWTSPPSSAGRGHSRHGGLVVLLAPNAFANMCHASAPLPLCRHRSPISRSGPCSYVGSRSRHTQPDRERAVRAALSD